MRWYATKNKWLDGWITKMMNFHSELDSCAAINSPLTSSEIDTISKALESINKVNEAVHKRVVK